MKILKIEEIRELIKCPQFGDNEYGKWGHLPLDVTYSIYRLIKIIENNDEIIKVLRDKNKLINEELKELKEGIEGVYNNMISLETINKYEENKEIEVI